MKKKDVIYSEEQQEIKRFVKILLVLILLFVGMYFLTIKVLNKKETVKRTNNEGVIQYSNIIVGQILSMADSEYYVLVFNSENIDNYDVLNKATNYKSGNKVIPLYTTDLSLPFNKDYVAEESSYDKKDLTLIRFKNTTLIKVKNGEIVKFIDESQDIINELK